MATKALAAAPARSTAWRGTGGPFILPATLLVLVMMVAPLVLLGRDSVNHFDPSLMMVAALTPENYVRFLPTLSICG